MTKKTTAGVVGAITALTGLPMAAAAEPAPAFAPAQSYADLLQPIPNAVERLAMSNAQEAQFIRARLQTQHHHHAQAAGAKPAQAGAHHHHAQTATGGAHHHHAQAAGAGAGAAGAAHHHHAQTTRPAGT